MLGDKPLLTANYVGDSGGSLIYYYWVQANFSWGKSPLSNPAQATVLGLGHNNVVGLNWTPMPGATSYDVLRNTTGTTPTGTQTVAIAQNYPTADGLVDNGLPAFSYTVSAGGTPASAAETEEKAKQHQEKINKEIDQALKEFDKKKEKQEKEDSEQTEKATRLNQLYNEGVKLDYPSAPKSSAIQALDEGAGHEQRQREHDKRLKEGVHSEREQETHPVPPQSSVPGPHSPATSAPPGSMPGHDPTKTEGQKGAAEEKKEQGQGQGKGLSGHHEEHHGKK